MIRLACQADSKDALEAETTEFDNNLRLTIYDGNREATVYLTRQQIKQLRRYSRENT